MSISLLIKKVITPSGDTITHHRMSDGSYHATYINRKRLTEQEEEQLVFSIVKFLGE